MLVEANSVTVDSVPVVAEHSSRQQGGITCEAIDEPGKSSKAIDKRVIINFRDKNVIIARFRDKNKVFVLFIIYICLTYIWVQYICENSVLWS